MTKQTRLLIGIALLIAGLSRMYVEAQTTGTLIIPGCLGSDFTVHLDAPLWRRVHCWGCYISATGGALIGSAALQNVLILPRRQQGL